MFRFVNPTIQLDVLDTHWDDPYPNGMTLQQKKASKSQVMGPNRNDQSNTFIQPAEMPNVNVNS